MNYLGTKSTLYIAIFVLVAEIAAGFTYIELLKYNLEQEAQFRAETEVAKSQKEQLQQNRSETDGWPIYHNEEWGIEFQYPTFGYPSTILISDINRYYEVPNLALFVDLALSPSESGTIYSISVFSNPSFVSLSDWFANTVDHKGLLLSSGAFKLEKLANGMEIIKRVGEIPATWEDGPVSGLFGMSTSTKLVVVVGLSNDKGSFNIPYNDVQKSFITMLESFTFFEPRSSDTSTWKTYRNEDLGIEFQYPGGWSVSDTSNGALYATFEISVYPVQNPSEFCERLLAESKYGFVCDVSTVIQIYRSKNDTSENWKPVINTNPVSEHGINVKQEDINRAVQSVRLINL